MDQKRRNMGVFTSFIMAKRTRKRMKVKGHYREVIRDALGKIVSSKKWSPKKKRGR